MSWLVACWVAGTSFPQPRIREDRLAVNGAKLEALARVRAVLAEKRGRVNGAGRHRDHALIARVEKLEAGLAGLLERLGE